MLSDLSLLLNLSNMAFFNFPNQRSRANTKLKTVSSSLVNPLYKPKTLSELKALMVHTGINPAPVSLRPGIPENNKLIDAIDAPPVQIGGDIFENYRNSARLADELKRAESDYQESKQKPTSTNEPQE